MNERDSGGPVLETENLAKGYPSGRGRLEVLRSISMSVARAEVVAMRNAKVPLNRKMGTGWDVGYAALFLASDEAKFITGVALPVDGGALLRASD